MKYQHSIGKQEHTLWQLQTRGGTPIDAQRAVLAAE